MMPRQAKRHMLESIQRNMASLKVNDARSSQLASCAVMRDERSIDNLYADLRAAGVRLPEIVGPVFEVSGYRSGGQDTQCFVSLSADAPYRSAPGTAAGSVFTTWTRQSIRVRDEVSGPSTCGRLLRSPL